MTILDTILIALAGGLGAVARMFAGKWIGKLPWGILTVNVVASFLAGFAAVAIQTSPLLAAMIIGGFCGGLSTFSTFAAQTVEFFKAKDISAGFFNLGLNFFLPTVAALGGVLLSYTLLK